MSSKLKKMLFTVSGMHCTSCVIDIDGELEDTEGITSANTNFAKSITEVTFDPKKITQKKILAVIRKVGYDATPHMNLK